MFFGRKTSPAAAQTTGKKVKVLHIDSSITGGPSASRQISAKVVATLSRELPDLDVVRRDLTQDQLPHFDGRMLAAAAQKDRVDETLAAELARNEAVLQEFLDAEIVVIGAPMYNFGIPTQLKAWIDRIAVAGRTFRYTENGPKGLAGGKKVIVASSRGGNYEPGTPAAALDFQESYLRVVFRFIGIEDVEFVRAEGVNLSQQHRVDAIKAAFAAAPAAVKFVIRALKFSKLTNAVEVLQAA